MCVERVNLLRGRFDIGKEIFVVEGEKNKLITECPGSSTGDGDEDKITSTSSKQNSAILNHNKCQVVSFTLEIN